MRRSHGRRHRRATRAQVNEINQSSSNNDDDDDYEDNEEDPSEEEEEMKCVSCKEDYSSADAGTCRECYEEAGETEEELKREIDDLKSKVNFLRFETHDYNPISRANSTNSPWLCFSDILLVASSDFDSKPPLESVPVPAHRAVLASRSPVFKAMLENEMEESISGTIKISDVSYDALRGFIGYLYTAEACLDEHMACDLLVLAEKYQVKHLKSYCEKFLISKLNWENALLNYAFAHQHNAKSLLDASLLVIIDNMDKLGKREEYKELVEKDARIVVEIYEAYLSKQVNTAALKDSSTKL